jgi:hypothetical protein
MRRAWRNAFSSNFQYGETETMNGAHSTIMVLRRFQWKAFGIAGLLASSFIVSSPALAQTKSGMLRDACREDYQRYCAKVQRGGGRIRQCMMENANQLTPQCRESLRDIQGSRKQQ